MTRSGTASTQTISFESGFPDAAIAYSLKENGTTLLSGTVTPVAGSLSVNVQINASYNTLAAGAVLGHRDFSWSYAVATIAVSGSVRYSVEAPIPFGVSADGVRNKLGLDLTDLPDNQVPLARAYLQFQDSAGVAALAALETATAYKQLVIADAIEAMAGLALIPSLQVRIAQSESSGTNKFDRQKIDWHIVREQLNLYISNGMTITTTGVAGGSLFRLASPAINLFPG